MGSSKSILFGKWQDNSALNVCWYRPRAKLYIYPKWVIWPWLKSWLIKMTTSFQILTNTLTTRMSQFWRWMFAVLVKLAMGTTIMVWHNHLQPEHKDVQLQLFRNAMIFKPYWFKHRSISKQLIKYHFEQHTHVHVLQSSNVIWQPCFVLSSCRWCKLW